jgi:K+-sensing histidine kinase KdpD
LYIVKKYLDLLGGNIEVQSRVGEGTTFVFQIPAPLHGNSAAHEQLLLPTANESFGADSR